MIRCVRMATRRDYHAMVKVRAEWLDGYCGAHRAMERWCPANAPVPWIEDEAALFRHLPREGGDHWALVLTGQGGVEGYMLCRSDSEKKELVIERGNPRVSPKIQLEDAGGELVEWVVRWASEEGLERLCISFHGFPDEVDPLVELYRQHGFEGYPRLEMVSRYLTVDTEERCLAFRSAEEIGLEAVCEVEAEMRGWSMEQTRRNLEFSQRMWLMPTSAWLVAYREGDPAGTVRMAMTHEGVGVVDAFGLLEAYRGQGLGIHLLAGGLSCLVGKTDIVSLDVDHDNMPAQRVYNRAGLRVHHHHGEMVMNLS